MRDNKQRRRPERPEPERIGRQQPENRRQANTSRHTDPDRRTGHDSNRKSVQRRSPDPAQRADSGHHVTYRQTDIRREIPRQVGVRQVVPGQPKRRKPESGYPREREPGTGQTDRRIADHTGREFRKANQKRQGTASQRKRQGRWNKTDKKEDTREKARVARRDVSERGVHNADLRQYIFVIRELTAREVKRKYVRSSLGIIWSVLNPLLTMIVMSLIFSTMFRRNIENFPVYYLTGQIFWTLFSTATNSAMSSLVDNRSLLIKAKLPKQMFILSRIYTALVNFGYTCIAYVLMLVVFRIQPHWTMALFFVDVAFVLILAMGVGYVLAVAYVFFEDIKYLYSVLLTLLVYFSALFYPADLLPQIMQKAISFNPVYLSVSFARDCVMYGNVPSGDVWLKLVVWCIGAFVLGLCVFLKKENQVMQKI